MTERRYGPEGSRIGTAENIAYTSSLRMLEKAWRGGVILEGIVTLCECSDMSLRVEMGCGVGIIPREEALYCPDGGQIKDIAIITRVGKPVCFKIIDMGLSKDGEARILLSRRAAQEECAKESLSRLRPGDVIPVGVTHLEPFGAFVDIGCGIVSLMTVDSISVSRIAHPRERLSPGEKIYAVVKSIDRDSGRIYMSLRELLGTWEENAAFFKPFQTVTGIVRSVEDYGVFVELAPNLAGLADVKKDVKVGDGCSVYIKSILPQRMKIKLVLIETHKNPPEGGIRYFIDPEKVRHISRWRYSPRLSDKISESVFDEDEDDISVDK